MDPLDLSHEPEPARSPAASDTLEQALTDARWSLQRESREPLERGNDLVIRRGVAYLVELRTASEGSAERLIPLWAQTCLEAVRAAGDRYLPLAVVAAPRVSPRNAEQLLAFAAAYAPDAAVGVIDFHGLRMFRGPGLENLDAPGDEYASVASSVRTEPDLFSDLNQWMLKVLLAPEIPDEYLSAPRERYKSAAQLARAANVTVMSASRLIQQLLRDGYLNESAPYFELARRDDLFRQWQAAAQTPVKEAPMRFLVRGYLKAKLLANVEASRACLATFEAANAMMLGAVHGTTPCAYVRRLSSADLMHWRNFGPAKPGETPDLILRQPSAPQSVFRGVVEVDGVRVCDVLQTWLDVSSDSTHGHKQADHIRRRMLDAVIQGPSARLVS